MGSVRLPPVSRPGAALALVVQSAPYNEGPEPMSHLDVTERIIATKVQKA